MTKPEGIFLQSFIDIETWNKAKWFAIAWAKSPDGGLPMMGCAFKDAKAGWKIFEDLQSRLGTIDSDELLRISVIEGDIPGKKNPGYSVTIGSHYAHVLDRAKRDNIEIEPKLLMSATRIHRMNPQPGAPNYLQMFKDAYAEHGRFLFLPFLPSEASPLGVEPVVDLAIGKTEIALRRIEDINDDTDFDSVVLRTPD